MTSGKKQYVRFDDKGVEPPVANEQRLTDELVTVAQKMQEHNFATHRHHMRVTHVKTQGIVKGQLVINKDLPEEFAHGIASPENAAHAHPVAIRFANEPSWLQDDRTPGPRGCSMRIFNVESQDGWLDESGAKSKTQDLTFNNAPQLELRNLPTTLDIFKIRERNFNTPEKIPQEVKKLRNDADLQLAPGQLPNHHFLGYTMYSQSAYRWGPYIAKYALFPTGPAQKNLAADHVIDKEKSDPDQHEKWLRQYFKSKNHRAEYELRVQLCENLAEQSVEDCGLDWSEERYPFRAIGQVVLPGAQDPFDPARRSFWDDRMKLNV